MSSYSRYPARVYRGDELLTNRGAVVVTDGRVRVAAFTADKKGVDVVLDEAGVESIEPHISRKVLLHMSDGETLTVDKGDGCSCRNVLQRWYMDERGRPARSGS